MPVDLRIAERRVFAVDTIDHALTYINESIAEGIEKNTVTITYTRSVSHDVQEAFGVRAAFNSANLAKPAEVQQMVEAATRELGKVDILAGIQHTAPIENFPVDRWDAVIAINLSANFHAIRAVIPQMRHRNWGRIINVASAHGLVASVITGETLYVDGGYHIID